MKLTIVLLVMNLLSILIAQRSMVLARRCVERVRYELQVRIEENGRLQDDNTRYVEYLVSSDDLGALLAWYDAYRQEHGGGFRQSTPRGVEIMAPTVIAGMRLMREFVERERTLPPGTYIGTHQENRA